MLVCTLHVRLGGLSDDNENLNWNKASMVLSKYPLTKLLSISKYSNFITEAIMMYVLETLISDMYTTIDKRFSSCN